MVLGCPSIANPETPLGKSAHYGNAKDDSHRVLQMNIMNKLCSRVRFVLTQWDASAFFRKAVWILISFFVVATTPYLRSAVPEPIMLQSVITQGTATATPEFGTWTIRYIVGYFAFARLVCSLSKSYVECDCDRREAQCRQIGLV